ncbi:hypothetical protein [Pseudomonas sp. S2_E02]
MFPTREGQRAALRRFETVEVNTVGIEAGQSVVRQYFVGNLMGSVEQTRAGLHDRRSNGFEGGFVLSVWQETSFGGGHAFFILEKQRLSMTDSLKGSALPGYRILFPY